MRCLLVLALAGCNRLFGLEPAELQTEDARVDAPGCAGSDFANPVQVMGSAMNASFVDPSVSDDPQELWFARTTEDGYDLFAVTRTAPNGPYDSLVTFPYNSTVSDHDPALSADGLVLIFLSERGNSGVRAYESRRGSVAMPFSPPVQLQLPDDVGTRGIDLSSDGLTLHYADAQLQLRSVQRADLASPFGAPTDVLASDVIFPTVSPDGLEVYYAKSTTTSLHRSTRASTTEPFSDERQIFANGADPEVSPDSTRLYFENGDTFMMSRSCN